MQIDDRRNLRLSTRYYYDPKATCVVGSSAPSMKHQWDYRFERDAVEVSIDEYLRPLTAGSCVGVDPAERTKANYL